MFVLSNDTHFILNFTFVSAKDPSPGIEAAVGVPQIVLGLVFNLFLLVVLLSKRELRTDVRNMLIINLVVADLLTVGVLRPADVTLEVKQDFNLSCYPHLVLQLLYFFAFNFVSLWGVTCLDALLLARLCRLDMPLTSFMTSAFTTSISVWKRRLNRAVVVLVVALPWLLSVIVITPIVFIGSSQDYGIPWHHWRCYFLSVHGDFLILSIFLFFLPCLLIFLLLSISVCVFCYRRRRGATGTTPTGVPPAVTSVGEPPSAGQQHRPTAYIAASLVTLVLTGPPFVLSLVNLHVSPSSLSEIEQKEMISFHFAWISGSKSVVLPLVWLLLLPDVRARARHLMTLGRKVVMRVKDEPRFDPSVSYKNL